MFIIEVVLVLHWVFELHIFLELILEITFSEFPLEVKKKYLTQKNEI